MGKQLDLLGGQPVFENPGTLVMAAVGRRVGDRLSSGGRCLGSVWSDRETSFVTYLQLK